MDDDDDCVYVWGDDSDLDYTSSSSSTSSDSEEDDGFDYYAQFSGGKPMPTREEQTAALYRADSRRRQSRPNPAMVLPSGFGRTLCLHYYSNIAVDLLPSENEEVYPLYSIKDWNDISIHWMDTFCSKERVKGTTI